MSKWDYLTTPLFRARYVLAAHFLPKHITTIVEVGGWKNCIVDYLESGTVIAIDPLLEIPANPRVQPYLMRVQDFPLELLRGSSFALVIMGFDILNRKDLAALGEMMNLADVIIVEHAIEHETNLHELASLLREVNAVPTLRIQIDLSGNHLEASEFPPFFKRELIMLERQT